jgi:hypothetical protein
MFRRTLHEDAAAVDGAFRAQWGRRCKQWLPYG